MTRRVAADPTKPLHPFNDANTHCEVCGKRWLDYLKCELKGCRIVYSPDAKPTTNRKRGGAGEWFDIFEGTYPE